MSEWTHREDTAPLASVITDEPAPVTSLPVPVRVRADPVRSPALAAPSASASVPTAPAESPVMAPTEVQLLRQAQASLKGNPAGALTLCAEHQRRFPGGVLGQERDVLAIDALSKLGRKAEARARADRFLLAYPTSAHRGRIEGLVGR